MFGKLEVIKMIGEKPTFFIKHPSGAFAIPDINDWLMERIGKDISLTVSDAYFQIADQEELHK